MKLNWGVVPIGFGDGDLDPRPLPVDADVAARLTLGCPDRFRGGEWLTGICRRCQLLRCWRRACSRPVDMQRKAGGPRINEEKYPCDFGHIYCVSTHSHLGKKMSGLMRVLVLILVREFLDDLQIGCC